MRGVDLEAVACIVGHDWQLEAEGINKSSALNGCPEEVYKCTRCDSAKVVVTSWRGETLHVRREMGELYQKMSRALEPDQHKRVRAYKRERLRQRYPRNKQGQRERKLLDA